MPARACGFDPHLVHLVDRQQGNPNVALGTVAPSSLPELMVADAAAWRTWLKGNHAKSPGVRLVLAKKGTTHPTTLSYDEALDEAICFGWIDGQLGRRDRTTFLRRFTPRNARSPWSQRNVAIAERLAPPDGCTDQAMTKFGGRRRMVDGRPPTPVRVAQWFRGPGEGTGGQPPCSGDVSNAYECEPVLHRLSDRKREEGRDPARRVEQFVEMLARGRPSPARSTPIRVVGPASRSSPLRQAARAVSGFRVQGERRGGHHGQVPVQGELQHRGPATA